MAVPLFRQFLYLLLQGDHHRLQLPHQLLEGGHVVGQVVGRTLLGQLAHTPMESQPRLIRPPA